MKLVADLVLDVLYFLDYASRLRMLAVKRRMHALVDTHRKQLALPEIWCTAEVLRLIPYVRFVTSLPGRLRAVRQSPPSLNLGKYVTLQKDAPFQTLTTVSQNKAASSCLILYMTKRLETEYVG